MGRDVDAALARVAERRLADLRWRRDETIERHARGMPWERRSAFEARYDELLIQELGPSRPGEETEERDRDGGTRALGLASESEWSEVVEKVLAAVDRAATKAAANALDEAAATTQ